MTQIDQIISKVNLKCKVISPLTILSGESYTPMDYVISEDSLNLIQFDKLMGILGRDFDLNLLLNPEISMLQIVEDFNIDFSEISNESIVYKGPPRESPISEIGKFIKTGDSHYIPGSSFKGAIRSVLARILVDPNKLSQNISYKLINAQNRRGKIRTKQMAEEIDKVIFGPDPNQDFLRMLKFSDSPPLNKEKKIITNGISVGSQKKESFIEAFGSGTDFTIQVAFFPTMIRTLVDNISHLSNNPLYQYLSQFKTAKELFQSLFWENNKKLLDYAKDELQFFQRVGRKNAMRVYQNLIKNLHNLEKSTPSETNRTFIQLGWGTGWRSKTYGKELLSNPDFEDLRKIYTHHSLYRPPPFPKTRKIAYNGYPFGWISIKIE